MALANAGVGFRAIRDLWALPAALALNGRCLGSKRPEWAKSWLGWAWGGRKWFRGLVAPFSLGKQLCGARVGLPFRGW